METNPTLMYRNSQRKEKKKTERKGTELKKSSWSAQHTYRGKVRQQEHVVKRGHMLASTS